MDFDAKDQILFILVVFCTRQILEKKWEYNKAVRRKALYNIIIEFGIPMKVIRLIKMCLNKTCSRVHVGKHLSDLFTFRNDLKQGDALTALVFNFDLEHAIRRVKVNQGMA